MRLTNYEIYELIKENEAHPFCITVYNIAGRVREVFNKTRDVKLVVRKGASSRYKNFTFRFATDKDRLIVLERIDNMGIRYRVFDDLKR